MNRYLPCPCDSKAFYAKCCGRYHSGELPPTALALMKSRYSAYAMNLPDYIMETTHPDNQSFETDSDNWRKGLEQFSQGTKFLHLKIVEFSEQADCASVTFTASLRQGKEDASFSERSAFVKENGRWLYRAGEILQ